MSIVKMRKMVRKNIRIRLFGRSLELWSPMAITFGLIVIIFIVGTYYIYSPGGGGGGPRSSERNVTPVIAVVDGHKISRNIYEARLHYQSQDVDVTQLPALKVQLLDSMIDAELLLAAAQAENIQVTDADIEARKDEIVEEMMATQYADRSMLRSLLEQKNMSLEEFKRDLRRNRLPDDDRIRTQLLFDKLEQRIRDSVNVTEEDVKEYFTEVKARHILIDPRRIMEDANSDEEGEDEGTPDEEASEEGEPETEDRMTLDEAKAEARERLLEIRQQIEDGADFAELAKQHSDCPSAEKGGDLGWFGRSSAGLGYMDPAFEEAALALEPGQLSDVVESYAGLHLIEVEDTRVSLPDGYEENKDHYREMLQMRREAEAWQAYLQGLRDRAEIEIVDPELKAYKLIREDPEKYGGQAAELLAAAAQADPYNVTARFQLAELLSSTGQTDTAIDILTKLVDGERKVQSAAVYLELGRLLKEAEREEEALQRLKSASEYAQGFDDRNRRTHSSLQALYQEMGKTDLAEREQEWLDEYDENMASMQSQPLVLPETDQGQDDEGSEPVDEDGSE